MLRNLGLRVTVPRLKALEYVQTHPHADADAIYTSLALSLHGVTRQTVHGIVNDLTRVGVLRRVSLPESASAHYETRIGDNHHHIQCVSCGRIEDVDCVVGEAPCLTPEDTHGMRLVEASVTFRGVCAECEMRNMAHEALQPSIPLTQSHSHARTSPAPTSSTIQAKR